MKPHSASIVVLGATDVGQVRESNEDAFVISEVASGEVSAATEPAALSVGPSGVLLMVCDGMGGAAAGEVAARLAGETVARGLFDQREILRGFPAASVLVSALRLANGVIFEESRRRSDERGMGTTCTAGLILGDRLVLAQVGDSRAYLFRQGALTPLTRDQSLAMQLIDAGVLSPAEAKDFAHSNVILQALGVMENVDPVTSEVGLLPGDLILICSDGLHGPVSEEKIAGVVAENSGLGPCARSLIHAALEAGGPDNVTVILARYDCAE